MEGEYWAEAQWEGTVFGPRVYRQPEDRRFFRGMTQAEQERHDAIWDEEYRRRAEEEGFDYE